MQSAASLLDVTAEVKRDKGYQCDRVTLQISCRTGHQHFLLLLQNTRSRLTVMRVGDRYHPYSTCINIFVRIQVRPALGRYYGIHPRDNDGVLPGLTWWCRLETGLLRSRVRALGLVRPNFTNKEREGEKKRCPSLHSQPTINLLAAAGRPSF